MNRIRFRSPLVWAPAFGVLAIIAGIVLFSDNEFVQRLCSTDFMPHGACYLWLPEILWLHVISDGLIALAYFLIPVGLVYFVTKRKGMRFRGVFWLFGAFILLCGMTHLLEVYSIWNAAYLLTGTVKFATGAVSLATAAYLIRGLPTALQIPFPEEMRQVQSHLRTETTVRETTQRELDTRNRQFAAILKGGLDAFILVDANGDAETPHRILEINEQAEREIGYTRDELLGQSLCDVFQRFAKLSLHDMLEKSKRDAATLYREVEVDSPSGQSRWLYIKAVPAGDAIAVFFADISDQKWAEAERRRKFERQAEAALKESEASSARAQAALATAVHGIIIVDTNGQIVETNPRLRAFFGYSEDELVGQPVELLVPESYRHSHRADRNQFHSHPVERRMGSDRSLYARRKDGSEFPVEVGLNPFSTPDGDYVMASVLDITERVAARQALESKNEEIEQMVYAVSHDLKAPLVSIQGLASLLTDTGRIEDPDTKSIVTEIDKSARQMSGLISDLLEMSRVGRAEETTESVDIGEVVEDVRAMLGIQSDKVGCQWDVNGPFPMIRASRKRIVQLLQNLCSNALKYGCGDNGCRIEIGGALTDASFNLWVQDFGEGIEESQHATVFEPFTRLNRHQEGTGIGLAIVAKIMKHYGGAAELSSSKGEGCRFTLRFPRSLLATTESESHPPNASSE